MRFDDKKVTIIVPVYNVEKYIFRTVVSIYEQDYKNLEIIIIDDGSTDKSPEIIDELKKGDERVQVIHNSNHGVSYTRNEGIRIATGEYIMFVDGDDYLENDHVSRFVEVINKNNADIAFSRIHLKEDESYNKENEDFKEYTSSQALIEIYTNRIFMAVWNKIYRREFIVKNDILFDEDVWYAEGMLFNARCLAKANSVNVANIKTYHYMNNPESAMRKSFSLRNQECALESLNRQEQIITRMGDECIDALCFHRVFIYQFILRNLYKLKTDKKDCLNADIKRYEKLIKRYKGLAFRLPFNLKTRIRWICICTFPRGIKLKDKMFKRSV